jgi:F-type H+-transporting ATPase subunit delta
VEEGDQIVARRAYARRYAQAVFEIALEKKELDRWQADLAKMASLAGEAAVIALLESPKVPFKDKVKLLSGQLGEMNPLALNLVYLLMARGRLGMLGDITDEYQRLLDSYHGIARAEVTAAVPLDDDDKQKLAERLGAITGKKVTVEAEVDPALLGGFTARIEGKLLDGSTRSKLLALKKELARGGR